MRSMINKVMVIPDSFKGSMSSVEVSDILGKVITEQLACDVIKIPIADGGEGSTECILGSVGGRKIYTKVHSPEGEIIEAYFGVTDDGKAVIEIAESSGITKQKALLTKNTATYGFGELIKCALDMGIRDFLLCLGGSATTDCGCGMAEALGAVFYSNGNIIHPCGANLSLIDEIDISGIHPGIELSSFTVMSDVENPLYGKLGAAYVYAPQKGVLPGDVELLDEGLKSISEIISAVTDISCRDIKGAGAAGGAGYGCAAFLKAKIVSGIDAMLEITGFKDKVSECDLIVTGEGKLDRQSLMGKVLSGIRKNTGDKKIVSFCGISELAEEACAEKNIDVVEIGRDIPLADSIRNGKELLEKAAEKYFGGIYNE